MELLIVVAEGKAMPGKEDALREALTALIAPTHAEEGCVQYDLHESLTEPGRFLFFERWTGKETLDRHAQSAHLKALGEVIGDLTEGGMDVRLYRQVG